MATSKVMGVMVVLMLIFSMVGALTVPLSTLLGTRLQEVRGGSLVSGEGKTKLSDLVKEARGNGLVIFAVRRPG